MLQRQPELRAKRCILYGAWLQVMRFARDGVPPLQVVHHARKVQESQHLVQESTKVAHRIPGGAVLIDATAGSTVLGSCGWRRKPSARFCILPIAQPSHTLCIMISGAGVHYIRTRVLCSLVARCQEQRTRALASRDPTRCTQ